MKKVKIKSGGNWIEMVALYIKSITTEFSAYIRMVLTDAGVATIEAVTSVNDGYAIRLVKN